MTIEPLFATLDQRIEAALFAASRPLKPERLSEILPAGADVVGAIERICAFWKGRGIQVVHEGGGYLMRARAELLPAEARLGSGRKLSEQAVATLAVIAMHQPVTLKQIETVRGVKLGRVVLDALVDAGLIEVVGRRRGTGTAAAYATTAKFLDRTGLSSLSDLPTPEEAFSLDLSDR